MKVIGAFTATTYLNKERMRYFNENVVRATT